MPKHNPKKITQDQKDKSKNQLKRFLASCLQEMEVSKVKRAKLEEDKEMLAKRKEELAYEEMQRSLSQSQPIQEPEHIFSTDKDGDIVMTPQQQEQPTNQVLKPWTEAERATYYEEKKDEGKAGDFLGPDPSVFQYAPGMRRPDDEFIDLTDIEFIRTENVPQTVSEDKDSLQKFVELEGYGALIGEHDTVRYQHETRFDNGQVVDLDERRKVVDKFVMSDTRYHDFIRAAFLTMKKGETGWLKLDEAQHKDMYHTSYKNCRRRIKEEKDKIEASIGKFIWMRIRIDGVSRNPLVPKQDASLEEKYAFANKIREVCKELIADDAEYTNAKQLYSRAVDLFKNMSKIQKDELTEQQHQERKDMCAVLYNNIAFCQFKKSQDYNVQNKKQCLTDVLKWSNEALKFDENNAKAHYRKFQALKEMYEFEKAKEEIVVAIKLDPSNKPMREEYDALVTLMSTKQKEWYDKMQGFYKSDKLAKIDQNDNDETELREKLKRQTFTD